MQIQSHYTTLGLAPTAQTSVIRAAYKALALLYHPDKTIHLPASERASHSANFRSVQEAFDVLGNTHLKASYDAELSQHDGTVDSQRSTFHASSHQSRQPTQGRATTRLTTAKEKAIMRAKTEASLTYLRTQPAARDLDETALGIVDLKLMLKTWKELAQENKHDAVIFAHCTIMCHEYEGKVQQKQIERETWVAEMSTPKCAHIAEARLVTPELEPLQDAELAFTPAMPKKVAPRRRRRRQSASTLTSPSTTSILTPRSKETRFSINHVLGQR